MEIAMSDTRQKFPLSRKKILKKTLPSMLALGILAIIGAIASGLLLPPMVAVGIIVLYVIIFSLVYGYQNWYFSTYFYDLNNDYVVIKKGAITPCEITVPYERIQDVYVDQDIWDRIMGLYDVHISSATASSGLSAHIDGVEKNAADGLRKLLLDTVSQKISQKKT
jgi:membrane protein YdbS with pleckstrin-like domain